MATPASKRSINQSKDFDTARRKRLSESQSFEFTLAGKTFHTLAVIPVGELMNISSADVTGTSLLSFVEACIIEEDIPELRAALFSKEDPIDQDSLLELVTWLMESIGGASATEK